MQLSVISQAFHYILFVLLCLILLFAAPGTCNLLCLGGNQNQGLLSHPLRDYFNENDTNSAPIVAATKAHMSPVVFRGTLLSVLVQRDGTVKASFSMDQSLKMDSGKRAVKMDDGQMEVVYLQRPSAAGPCVFEVNEDNLKLGSPYVVFGRLRNGTKSSVTATAFPIPYEKRTFRAIRRVVCKGCAKPPRVEGLRSVRIVERTKLRLQCHLSGNPIPLVRWYKDGQRLDGKGRVKVRTKRRTSRLIIRQSRLRDRGVYECRAANIVQGTPASAKALVVISKKKPPRKKTTTRPPPPPPTIPTTTISSIWPIGRCPNSNFCLNGGTCIFFQDVREYVCHCPDGFVGLRCDFKDVQASVGGVKILDETQNRYFVTVVVLFIILSCLNCICPLACWLYYIRKKKKSFQNVREMAALYFRKSFMPRRNSVKKSNIHPHVDFKSSSEKIELDNRQHTNNAPEFADYTDQHSFDDKSENEDDSYHNKTTLKESEC